MKKEVRRFKVDFNFNWTYGVDIKQLRDDLDELEKIGADTIDIQAEENYGCASVTIEAFADRMETDEEFEARVNEFNRNQEDIKRRELEQLGRLKSKYGL